MIDETTKEILECIGSRSSALDVTVVTGTQYRDCTFIQITGGGNRREAAEGEAHHTAAEANKGGGGSTEAAPDASGEQVARAIHKVMELKDEKGDYLFGYATQWQGIYRVLVDNGTVRRRDYTGFGHFIASLCPEQLRIPLDAKALSKTDVGIFARPLKEWDVARYNGTRTIFFRYECVAKAFLHLLGSEK